MLIPLIKTKYRLTIPRKVDFYQLLFVGLVIYYWFIQYVYGKDSNLEQFSLLYFLTVLPLLFFLGLNLPNIVKRKWKAENQLLFYYILLVSVVSFFRTDFGTIYNTFILCMVFIAVNNTEVYFSNRILNTLFFLSIIGSVITYYTGSNLFGFIPGMAKTNIHQGLSWRVSLFPSLPTSAFFSLLVFTRNYFTEERGGKRYLILALSAYFIILSASRSAIFALGLVFVVNLAAKIFGFYGFRRYLIFSLSALALVIIITIHGASLAGFAKSDSQFIRSLIFRTTKTDITTEQIKKENFRTWIWSKHMDFYKENPIAGRGDYDFSELITEEEKSKWRANYSESFFTNLMVELGLLSFLFFGFILTLVKVAVRNNDLTLYSTIISLMVLMFLYGSFMVPYNVIFLLFAGSIYQSNSTKKHQKIDLQ